MLNNGTFNGEGGMQLRKRGMGIAAVAMAAGMLLTAAPAASADTTEVPCETIFGEYICNQISSTGQFVDETIANAVGAVEEWRDRAAALGKSVTDYVWCVVSGACPLTSIEP